MSDLDRPCTAGETAERLREEHEFAEATRAWRSWCRSVGVERVEDTFAGDRTQTEEP